MSSEINVVKHLSQEVKELKDLIMKNNSTHGPAITNDTTNKTMWCDEQRVHQMKSSLVIKHKSSDVPSTALDLNVVREIAVKNSIPVTNIGVSKKGNTFIHCPSAEARDKLQPLLINANLVGKDVVSVKEKSPHITIVDIIQTGSEELTKENILVQICSQNPKLAALIESGNEFKVLFIKKNSQTKKFSAAVRVSCDIRRAIKSDRDRIYVGISSCRVYDRFYVKRCNNCQQFGHFKDSCQNETVCGHCSGPHQSEGCSLKESKDFSKLKCTNCKDAPGCGNGHSAFWYNCPAYKEAQKKLRSTISYYDGEVPNSVNLNR